MNFIIILLSIIIIFLLFLIYRYFMAFNTPLVTNLYLKTGIPDIELKHLKIKDFGSYNIEFWMYVNSVPDISFAVNAPYKYNKTNNQSGCIFQTSSKNLSIDLYSNNILTFYNGRNNGGTTHYPSVIANNFPIQKWTYVIISVENNSLVDLYINGKLVQSSNYNGLTDDEKIKKPTSTEKIEFGNILDAYITKMHFNSGAMFTSTAWKNYVKGNKTSVSNNLNISLNLTQNGKDSNKFQIL